MEVVAPDGRTWRVRRRWLPGYATTARRRWRKEAITDRVRVAGDAADVADAGCLAEVIEMPAILLVVLAIVALILLGFIAVPLLLDAVIILLAVLLGGVVRTVFRRPWTVEAVSGEERRTRQVVGWFASGRAAAAWADELRHGQG